MFINETFAEERKDRALLAAKIKHFGISFLDDALRGVFPNDLILVCAKTGAGKSWDERTVLVTGALVCHEYETSDVEDDAGDKARAFLAKYFPKGGGMSYGKCPLCAFDFSTSAGRTHANGYRFEYVKD